MFISDREEELAERRVKYACVVVTSAMNLFLAVFAIYAVTREQKMNVGLVIAIPASLISIGLSLAALLFKNKYMAQQIMFGVAMLLGLIPAIVFWRSINGPCLTEPDVDLCGASGTALMFLAAFCGCMAPVLPLCLCFNAFMKWRAQSRTGATTSAQGPPV